jgi:hypothetical protein
MTSTLSVKAEGFLLKEAEQLRNLYMASAKEIGSLERYTLIATGAIWSWGLAQQNESYVSLLAWVPLVLQIFFGLRAWGIYQDMVWIRKYLSEIETTMGIPEQLGWGHRRDERKRRLRVITGFAFWIALPLLTVLVAVAHGFKH